MRFMDENFLLETETARKLYHNYAKEMPIIDYHCHINPQEIYEDRRFDNITQMYHWTHLELKTYFGYDGVLDKNTAKEVWDICNAKLAEDNMSARNIILRSNVKMIGTTDDPIDSLEWHKTLREEGTFPVAVLPSFRPDKAVNIEKAGFTDYIAKLAAASETDIKTAEDVKKALSKRLDYFCELGCKSTDHGLDYVVYEEATDTEIEAIFAKALAGEKVTQLEADKYKTAILLHLGREYARHNIVMQLHYGAQRNTNTAMFNRIGPDTGFDCISTYDCGNSITKFLNALEIDGLLPKTIVYSLNPHYNELIDTIIGAFQGTEIAGKIQHGSAWWLLG